MKRRYPLVVEIDFDPQQWTEDRIDAVGWFDEDDCERISGAVENLYAGKVRVTTYPSKLDEKLDGFIAWLVRAEAEYHLHPGEFARGYGEALQGMRRRLVHALAEETRDGGTRNEG